MGLLDRFKKAPGPDALTWEAVARARAVPGVAGAEAVDADTVAVTWATRPGTTTLSLAEIRDEWTKASGFARIELMDGVVAGLTPPADVPGPDDEPPAPASTPATAAPADADDRWAEVEQRLAIRIGAGAAGPVRWPIVGGLEATVVLDRLDGRPVAEADLAEWQVGADVVCTAARRALESADPELDPIGPGQPAWVPTVPAEHPPVWLAAPSRLLTATGIAEVVALAPTPTELVVVDPSAIELLASVLAGTRSIVRDADDVLLAAPLLVTAGGVEEWRPGAEHPCAGLVAELREV